MKIPESFDSWKEYLLYQIENNFVDQEAIAIDLCKWISEDDCEEFVRIYDLYQECDYE